MSVCASEVLLVCEEDALQLTTSMEYACIDSTAFFERCLDGSCLYADACECSSNRTTQTAGGFVQGTVLDICFCSLCVAGAFVENLDALGGQGQAACRGRAGTSHEQAMDSDHVHAHGLAGTLHEQGMDLDNVHAHGLEGTLHEQAPGGAAGGCVSACSSHNHARPHAAVQISHSLAVCTPVTGVDTACRSVTASGKRAYAAPVPHAQTAPSAQEECKQMKFDARKQKNRQHAQMSRVRRREREKALMQREAELKDEIHQLQVLILQLKHEKEELEVEPIVDVFLS